MDAWELLQQGANACSVVVAEDGDLLGALFLAGLVGGFSHCTGMCGPFVLTQVSARLEAVPAAAMREFHRLTGAALVPYHLGRGTTYALMGAVAAALTGGLSQLAGLRWLSAVLLVVAALFFFGYGLFDLRRHLPGTGAGGGAFTRFAGRLAGPLFAAPTGWRGYGLGLVLGLIPCGLVYGALAAAAASGSALAGALAMAAFTLGTVPALIVVGVLGHVAGGRFRRLARMVAPVLMMVNGGVLTLLAWRMVA